MSEKILVECPGCRGQLKTGRENLGRRGACKRCGHAFLLWPYAQVPCPSCRRDLRLRREYLGTRVRCRHCRHNFLAPTPANPPDTPSTSVGRLGGVGLMPMAEIGSLRSLIDELRRLALPTKGPEAGPFGNDRDELATARDERDGMRAGGDRADALERELGRLRPDCDRIRQELDALRRVLEESRAGRDGLLAELDGLRSDLADVCSERDRHATGRKAALGEVERYRTLLEESGYRHAEESQRSEAFGFEAERLRARLDAAERCLAEAMTSHEADLEASGRALHEARDRAVAEGLALESIWEGRLRAHAHVADSRLVEEGDRAAAERLRLEEECSSLHAEIDRLGSEVRAASRERDDERERVAWLVDEGEAACRRIGVLEREKALLAAKHVAAHQTIREAEEGHGVELGRAMVQLTEAIQMVGVLEGQIRDLRADAERLGCEREEERRQGAERWAALERDFDSARKRALATKEDAARPGRDGLERDLAAADLRLEEASERADRLESDARKMRSRIAVLNRDLALADLCGAERPATTDTVDAEFAGFRAQEEEQAERARIRHLRLHAHLDSIGLTMIG